MRAVFMRKEPEIDTKEFQVEKVITLPSEQYAYFTQHLMKEHDFIKENVDLMYEKDGVWHCLLVAGEGMDEGVLVESEGSAYARYSAFVPFAQEIIRQYMRLVLRSRERTMMWFWMHFPSRETAILYLSFIWSHTIRPIQMESGWMTFYRK